MTEISLELANKLFNLANLALILGAVFVLFGTWGTIKTAAIKERYGNERISKNEADTARANAEAAEANARAEKAKLETERIKKEVAWRTIFPETALALEKVLITKPGSVNLRYTQGDPEALFFAAQFGNILKKAGWEVYPGAVLANNALVFGIVLPTPSGDDAEKLREALTSASIPFATGSFPQGSEVNAHRHPNAPTLMVGSRPPLQFQ